MTMRWQDKDPGDSIVVEFDFSDDATAVTSPTVTVTVLSGEDPAADAIKVGAPTVDGAIVRQRLTGGLDGVEYGLQCAAQNGADVLTIEAILPVIARPIAIPETARYLTRAQFEQRFGVDETVGLLENGAAYARAENEAASLIDGFLASRYTLPLASVPEIVRGWAADVVRFKLWDEQAPEEVRRRYDDALAQLRDLARGLIALPPDAAGVQVAPAGDFAGYSADRVFTMSTLCGY
jgi:phage gp36-like protein